MNTVLSGTALVIVYSGVALVGLALIGGAIVSLLRSFTPGRQTRPQGATRPIVSRAVTYSLGLGATVFGIAGLVAHLLLRLQPVTGILIALGLGLLVGFIALVVLVYLPARGQVEEELLDFDAAGRRAEVVIPIPVNGIGEVVLREGPERVNLGARSATGMPIPSGTVVVIERVTKRVAVVTPLP
jgi:hypothetical protein